jgi:hypothetical protein
MNTRKISSITNEIICAVIELDQINSQLERGSTVTFWKKIWFTDKERRLTRFYLIKRKRVLEAQIKHFINQLHEL